MSFGPEDTPGLFYFTIVLGALLLWCCCTHCLLMRCCTCLKRNHKLNPLAFKTKQPFRILSSHRGGSAERCENTLAAFKYSLELGINLLELDVHMSKDGEVVIAHDADLGRMCGEAYKDKKLNEYNYEDLPPM